jgi:hypothetical protein
LASDDAAQLVALKPPPIRVAVDASDPFFFENSVMAFSHGQDLLSLVDGTAEGSEFDVTLAKGTAPDAPLAIIFEPTGESVWWKSLGDEVEVGAARVLVENHPALRHLEPAAITFVGARQITPPAGAQILVVDDRDTPLIYLARREGHSAMVVNIDPLAADFYFSAWFPVLIHSAATYLAGRDLPLAASYKLGAPVPIPGARDDSIARVTFDEANSKEVRGKWWDGAEQLGFFHIENETGTWPVGISLLAAEETLLDNRAAASTDGPGYLLTILAIVALTAESLLYHRRKVG